MSKGEDSYIYLNRGRALPNGNAFVGSDIFPQLPSLYGILQNKGYFLLMTKRDSKSNEL